jgi:outer membrane protein TolC
VAEAEAIREQAVAAGQVPDPVLRLGVANLPVDSLALDRDGMTMVEIGVQQQFPAGRSRALARARLEHHARHLDAGVDARRREVRLEVERLWWELDFLEADLRLLVQETEWARLILDLEEQRIERQRASDVAAAQLARWLGPMRPGERLPAPAPAVLAGPDDPAARLSAHPLLQGSGHEVGVAAAEVALARERYKPAFGIEVGYGFRQGREMFGDRRPDMLNAMLTVDLPLFTRQRQDRELAAARAGVRAAEARSTEAHRELESRLAVAIAESGRLREMLALNSGEAQRLAVAMAEAALAAYRSGEGPFDTVLAARRQQLELRQRELRLRTDLAITAAEIHYLVGETP